MKGGRGLVLVGARGAGKSTVGAELAMRVGAQFVDTDGLVAMRAGMSIARLFAERGEAAFRDAERTVIATLDPATRQVVACGGGAVADPENARRLAAMGPVVWLTARSSVLASRIEGSDRPSLTGAPIEEEIGELLAARSGAYHALATWTVDTEGRTPEEISDELEQLWRGVQDHDVR